MKIVLVEDDLVLAQLISERLRQEHYVVELATNGLEGLELTRSTAADLWIIDVELPKLSGFQLCQHLRQQGIQAPILLLTARRSEADLLTGFNLGADDYLSKPFQVSELLVRVRALLRRPQQLQKALLSWGILELSTETATVTYGGKPVSLRPKEYKLLEILMRHGRQILNYEQLFDQLWTLEEAPNKESLKAHIKGVRQALKSVDAPPDLIEVIRGLGVRLNPTYEKAEQEKQESPTVLPQLQAAWPSFKPKMLQRIQLLETAIGHLERGQLPPDLWEQAHTAAHTLAGSLGTFGFDNGALLAQEIEDLLSAPPYPQQSLQEKIFHLKKELEQDQLNSTSMQADFSLLLIGSEPETLELIKEHSSQWGIEVNRVASVGAAKMLINQRTVDVILLDLGNPQAEKQGIQLAKRLGIPFILCLQEDHLAARVEAKRKGASACLPKPCLPQWLLQTAQRVALQGKGRPMRVLAVDDDPDFLEILKSLLGKFCQLTLLQNPLNFWEILQEIMPDLLLLDVKLPHFSGIDLCHAVRTDSRFDRIPIVMITGHPNELSATEALAMGANDYLSKPIDSQELRLRLARHRFVSASAVASLGV